MTFFFEFPNMWGYLGFAGNWLAFFLLRVDLGIYGLSNEVSYKTMRQNIITGMERKEFYLGKALSITVLSLGATIFYMIIGLIIGFCSYQRCKLLEMPFDNSWGDPKILLDVYGIHDFWPVLWFYLPKIRCSCTVSI